MSFAVPGETTALIPDSPKATYGELFPINHGLKGLDKAPSVSTELSILIRTSIPLAAGLLLEMMLNTISVLVVGRLGSRDLAVIGNSTLLTGVTGKFASHHFCMGICNGSAA